MPDAAARISAGNLQLLCGFRELTESQVLSNLTALYDPPTEAALISATDLRRYGLGIGTILRDAEFTRGIIDFLEGAMLDGHVLAGSQEWVRVEFEVALDSGCHVCAPYGIPGYVCEESAAPVSTWLKAAG